MFLIRFEQSKDFSPNTGIKPLLEFFFCKSLHDPSPCSIVLVVRTVAGAGSGSNRVAVRVPGVSLVE